MLRKKGVVGKFVEFYGSGLSTLSVPDRATIANMAPEYGATMGFFPVDAETLAYLQFTARSAEQIALVEAYCKEQMRSEEHTSELQSQSNLVCRLLLEKKKKKTIISIVRHSTH